MNSFFIFNCFLILIITQCVLLVLADDNVDVDTTRSDITGVVAFIALLRCGCPFSFNDSPEKRNKTLQGYQSFFRLVLSLRIPMVIFTDKNSYNFALETRNSLGLGGKTKVYLTSVEEIPLFANVTLFQEIVDDEQKNWKKEWDESLKDVPQMKTPDYFVLVNSKVHFLKNVTTTNPFNTKNFAWIDPKYGRGDMAFFPKDFVWRPNLPENKITLLKVSPPNDTISSYDKEKLYRKKVKVLDTDFFAGDSQAIDKLEGLYSKRVLEMASQDRIIDDDQTLLTLMAKERPEMFNVVQGNNAFQIL